MYSSSFQQLGGKDGSPDYLYYNADIVNNTTADTLGGAAVAEPAIRFNETRDTALIKNAADYYFSIIRFTMNGASKDLPLFIPSIQETTGQTNPNLSVYSMAVPFQQQFAVAAGTITATGLPTPRYIQFASDTTNNYLAPAPRSLAASTFKNFWNSSTPYRIGDIVSYRPSGYSLTTDPLYLYNSYSGPFYIAQVPTPDKDISRWTRLSPQPDNPRGFVDWNGYTSYTTGQQLDYNSVVYQASTTITGNTILNQTPSATNIYWSLTDDNQGQSQDLSSRYYWIYTYSSFVKMWNDTMFQANAAATPGAVSISAWQDTYNAVCASFTALSGGATLPATYTTFGAWCAQYAPPRLIYNSSTNKFSVLGSNYCFGDLLQSWTATSYSSPTAGMPASGVARLFFNGNLFGLLSNFLSKTYNDPGLGSPSPYPQLIVPDGYNTEILFINKFYQNVIDYRNAPYAAGGNPPPAGYVPASLQFAYWVAEQDYPSTDSLWSPISSLVFTTSLLPIKTEATGQPVVLGNGNIGVSAPTSQSAFQPIITDIAIDTSQGVGSAAYRQFVYYAPQAEYRLADFSSSKQDIRNIDINVFWKNRLDNNLYPIRMFNLSSVSIKVMFKHKDAGSGKSYDLSIH